MAKRRENLLNRLFGEKEKEEPKEQPEIKPVNRYRFPVGNKFWEARTKHGVEAILETPQIMWEAACEYFTWCVDNPIIETDYRGKDLQEVSIPKVRAFTWIGLTQFIKVNKDYFTDFKDRMSSQDTEKARDFTRVISEIEGVIYRQKFENAAAGQLNANLISRELGLADKKEIDNKGGFASKIEVSIVSAQDPDAE